jgi:hypothetical protein
MKLDNWSYYYCKFFFFQESTFGILYKTQSKNSFHQEDEISCLVIENTIINITTQFKWPPSDYNLNLLLVKFSKIISLIYFTNMVLSKSNFACISLNFQRSFTV